MMYVGYGPTPTWDFDVFIWYCDHDVCGPPTTQVVWCLYIVVDTRCDCGIQL